MGYYRSSMYRGRGDYYRGDYYRGSRGDFWDEVGGFLGNVGGGLLSGAGIGSAVAGAGIKALMPRGMPNVLAATSPGSSGAAMLGTPMLPAAMFRGGGGGDSGGAGATRVIGKVIAHKGGGAHIEPGGGGGRRRMNVCNMRALRRALRRAGGFKKVATKVLKLEGEKRHVVGFKKSPKKT